MTRLVVESLDVRHGATALVSGLTWSHGPGRVAWLSGPNGSGKSSLMRVLAGLSPAAAGTVVRQPVGRIGYFHPEMGLPREARARTFVELTRRLASAPHPLEPDRAVGRKHAGSLSTGEAKRLLLGPVLARGADFLLLDEPYEHLSEGAREELTAALTGLALTRVVVVATNQPLPAEAEAHASQALQVGRMWIRA